MCINSLSKKLNSFSFAMSVSTQHSFFETCKEVSFAYIESIINYEIVLWHVNHLTTTNCFCFKKDMLESSQFHLTEHPGNFNL